MILVRHALAERVESDRVVKLRAPRLLLAKTRWRAAAEDGADFGFDLQQPLRDGDSFHRQGETLYVIEQEAEAVLLVDPGSARAQWARIGWALGNLHQPVEVTEEGFRLADDPAARQRIAQMGLSYRAVQAVFHPPRTTAHAHHGAGHDHA